MILRGQIHRQGRQWVAEVPLLHLAVAGAPDGRQEEALKAVGPCLRRWTGDPRLKCKVEAGAGRTFYLRSEDLASFLPLVLRRSREKARLSLAEVTARLGYRSRNAYAQYEAGRTRLSFAKYCEIMQVLDPDFEVALDRVRKNRAGGDDSGDT